MRRFILILALLYACPIWATAPTKVEIASAPDYNAATNISTWKIRLLHTPASGDTLLAACWYSSSTATTTFTDDASNTWTTDKRQADGGGLGPNTISIGHANVTTATSSLITATFSATQSSAKCWGAVVNNLAASPVDVSCGATTSGTPITGGTASCGSMTTTQTNDYIVVFGLCTDCGSPNASATWTAGAQGSGFSLVAADGSGGPDVFESQTWTSSGAINPSVSLTGGGTTVNRELVAGVAYKTVASAGGAACSGNACVNSIEHLNLPENISTTATSFTFQIPCGGTNSPGLVAMLSQSNTLEITAVSSTNPTVSAWSQAPDSPFVAPAQFYTAWYAANIVPTTSMTMTITTSAAPDSTDEIQMAVFCISNAATSPFDKDGTNSGIFNSVTGTISNALTITPSNANSLILFIQNEDSQVCDSINIGTQNVPKLPGYQNIWTVQDACVVHLEGASASSQAFSPTYIQVTGSGSGVVNHWGNFAMVFKSSAAAAGCSGSIALMGVGCR